MLRTTVLVEGYYEKIDITFSNMHMLTLQVYAFTTLKVHNLFSSNQIFSLSL